MVRARRHPGGVVGAGLRSGAWSGRDPGAWSAGGRLVGVGRRRGCRWLEGSPQGFGGSLWHLKVRASPERRRFQKRVEKKKPAPERQHWQGGKGMGSRGTGDRLPGSEVDGMWGARGKEDPERSVREALTVASPHSRLLPRIGGADFPNPYFPNPGSDPQESFVSQ